MNLKRIFTMFIVAAALLTVCVPNLRAAESADIAASFVQAFDGNDSVKMNSIVEENKARIPAVVHSIVEAAIAAPASDEKEAHFYMAEMMARLYKDSTGDTAPLLEVKRKSFDARLAEPQRPEPVDGVYIIEIPKTGPGAKNVFRPNNLVVKKGSTVRWVNKDEAAHIFASMPVIGKGGITSPTVEPGASWEHKFDVPGEYFYICFIHHAMVGKLTVE